MTIPELTNFLSKEQKISSEESLRTEVRRVLDEFKLDQ
jgi:hypothetical protein